MNENVNSATTTHLDTLYFNYSPKPFNLTNILLKFNLKIIKKDGSHYISKAHETLQVNEFSIFLKTLHNKSLVKGFFH